MFRRMKVLRILPVMVIACATVSCQKSDQKTLADANTPSDSLMYYLGQRDGAFYLNMANRDTVFKQESEKKAFLTGVKDGLKAVKADNKAYNEGIQKGIEMATQILDFCKKMDVEMNSDFYLSSLTRTIMDDSLPSMNKVQADFNKVMTHIQDAKLQQNQKESRESLRNAAKTAGLPKISDDLYGKALDKVEGEDLTQGTEINLVATVTKLNGDPIKYTLPKHGKVGLKRSFPDVVNEALKTLKNNQTGEFLTTANALFFNTGEALMDGRDEKLNLKPSDIIKMNLTPSAVQQEATDLPAGQGAAKK